VHSDAASVPKVALSTASVYPETTAAAFEMAARLGYDGIEIMVWNDPVSQDADALLRLSEHYRLPIVAIHAPCLVMTQRVWGTEPWGKLRRAREVAQRVGASAVIVHPPFRWQLDYLRTFARGLAELTDERVTFAVENMFPLRARGREVSIYAPSYSPVREPYPHLVLDLSHAAVARTDSLLLMEEMGERLTHVHVGDGTGANRDEHLVPGRGTQPCGLVLQRLVGRSFEGQIVVEINTRRAGDRTRREEDLAESLAFTRLHLSARPTSASSESAVHRSASRVESAGSSESAGFGVSRESGGSRVPGAGRSSMGRDSTPRPPTPAPPRPSP
jgi:sugar phosphate isomerase/epimerase